MTRDLAIIACSAADYGPRPGEEEVADVNRHRFGGRAEKGPKALARFFDEFLVSVGIVQQDNKSAFSSSTATLQCLFP